MPHRIPFEEFRKCQGELENDVTVLPRRSRRHKQLPVDDLVTIVVVWNRADHLRSPFPFHRRRHGHTIHSSAEWIQANIRRA